MRLLAISGSLRARSATGAVLRSALDLWQGPTGAAALDQLPPFNPDLDGEEAVPPPPVAVLRTAVAAADAVLLVSPEYAAGPPGALKNALDWLVSSGEFVDRPTAVVTASPFPAGGDLANAQLRGTLRKMSADLVEASCREIGAVTRRLTPAGDRVADEATLADLREALRLLALAATG
ncbi:NADPH-dependent FMN reductase [Streptomyces sp. NPDC059740]|uniref:NADPH-dependent FMN reductase n=1 Tax=Streptomyces sp. NPDC059740 TaxID=3346926 RepID=UPI00364A6456